MKVLVDIDGVLAYGKENHRDYSICKPNIAAISFFNYLYKLGHIIVIYTSRFFCDKEITEGWLLKNGILYHEIIFDKPQADIYFDDKAVNIDIIFELFGHKNV
jgi:hypothetical protein